MSKKELIGKNGIVTIKELINPKEDNTNLRKNKIGGTDRKKFKL